MVIDHPDDVGLATSTTELRSVVDSGRRAILLGVEGGHAIEDSLEHLRELHRLGARYLTLAHNNTNHWADSSGDVAKHHGLTPFGDSVVAEMNRLGMMVDVSHASDDTFYRVIAVTKAPVIASHSSARALCSQKRNMTDDMLRALGKNGGVAMVNFLSIFLSDEYVAAWRKRHAAKGDYPLPPVPVARIVDHIDHMVKVAGIDHVGLGSDFSNEDDFPQGMQSVDELPAIEAELRRRNYSDEDVHKILGDNFMRVFSAVEAAAEKKP